MKRLLIIAALAICFSIQGFSQIQISTKKVIIEDLPDKTLYIVKTGDRVLDSLMLNAFHKSWRISPFDVCGDSDFDALCSSTDYYFLLFDSQGNVGARSEGVISFTIYEGGFIRKASSAEDTREGRLDRLYKVISVPICSETGMDSRSSIYLPSILASIQEYLWKAMENDVVGYGGLSVTANDFNTIKDKTVLIAKSDLGSEFVSDAVIRDWFWGKLKCTESSESDAAFLSRAKDTVVSFTIVPARDGISYRMLIDCQTGRICFYQSARVTRTSGFTISDVKTLAKLAN